MQQHNCEMVSFNYKLKPFSCLLCQKSFDFEENLLRHQQIHRKKTPLSFSLAQNLSQASQPVKPEFQHALQWNNVIDIGVEPEPFIENASDESKSEPVVQTLTKELNGEQTNEGQEGWAVTVEQAEEPIVDREQSIETRAEEFTNESTIAEAANNDKVQEAIYPEDDSVQKDKTDDLFFKEGFPTIKVKTELLCQQEDNSQTQIETSNNHWLIVPKLTESTEGALYKHATQTYRREKQATCHLCQKMFYTNKDVIRHINAVHKNIRPYSCFVCHVSFKEKSKLTKHLKTNRHKTAEMSAGSKNVSQHDGELKTEPSFQIVDGFKDTSQSEQNNISESNVASTSQWNNKSGEGVSIQIKTEQSPQPEDEEGNKLKHQSQQNNGGRVQSKKKILSCHECGHQFKKRYNLERHLNSVHKKPGFWCTFCGKSFIKQGFRDFHVRHFHGNKDLKVKGKSESLASGTSEITSPLEGYIENKDLKLENKSESVASSLLQSSERSHISGTLEIPLIPSHLEGYIEITPQSLTHQEVTCESLAQKEAECEPQSEPGINEIKAESIFEQDRNTESSFHQENKYEKPGLRKQEVNLCTICNKTFSFTHDLLRHIAAVHEEIKPYECTLCDKLFASKSNLNGHINAVHKKLKPFSCTLCEKSFSFKNVLNRHFRAVHYKLKPHSCTLCNASFATKSDLSIHNRYHTNHRPFCCGACDKHFFTKHHLKAHKCQGRNQENSLVKVEQE